MNWWAWMNQQVHLKFKQSKITKRKWKATCMHLSASKISVLAASKAFHYSCSKDIQIFISEAEITYASKCIIESSEKQFQYLPWFPFCSCGTAITQWVQQGILTCYGKCICLSSVSDTAPTGSTKLLLLVLMHLERLRIGICISTWAAVLTDWCCHTWKLKEEQSFLEKLDPSCRRQLLPYF